MPSLSPIERRLLGTLIEKSLTTPQGYPLSLNSLTTGCNQKSARDPETNYTDDEVQQALQGLKRRSLAAEFFGAGSRVPKYEEALTAVLNLSKPQAAVLAELLLRGAQTEGELRQRASRMAEIPDLGSLHAVLTQLAERAEPLVARMSDPSRSRGVMWAHCMYPADEAPTVAAPSVRTPVSSAAPGLEERLAALEARVAELERRLGAGG